MQARGPPLVPTLRCWEPVNQETLRGMTTGDLPVPFEPTRAEFVARNRPPPPPPDPEPLAEWQRYLPAARRHRWLGFGATPPGPPPGTGAAPLWPPPYPPGAPDWASPGCRHPVCSRPGERWSSR